MNDFEAIGYSVLSMKMDEFHQIQIAKNNKSDKCVVVGAGTGIGVVMVTDY